MPRPSASAAKRLTTRPPLERMQAIFHAIERGSFPNREQLSADLEVTTKTIQRDLDFMRDRLNVPIAYDREHGGYTFTQEVTSFPLLELSEAEVVSVYVAQKALTAYRGTPFEAPLRSAYQKLVQSLDGRVSVQWSDLGQGVSFRTFQSTKVELTVFERLSAAVRDSRVVRFPYTKLGSKRPERRTVEPYHLACVHGQWYCVAFDQERGDWRNFALARMLTPEVQDKTFSRDRKFDINTYLSDSIGIFTGKGSHRVRLAFDAWSAQLIRERTWHHAQELSDLPNGGVELSLTLSSLEEIEPWILSWGEHVQVLAPKLLQQRLTKSVEQMLRNLNRPETSPDTRKPRR